MTPTAAKALAAVLLPAASGCMSAMMAGHAAPPATPPAAASPAGEASVMQTCPMGVPGTQVVASDAAGGAALTFTTTTGDVGELRKRARALAEHGHGHASGTGMQHMHGGMGHGGAMMGPGTMGPGMMGGGSMGGGSTGGGSMGGGSMGSGSMGGEEGGHGTHGMAMPPSHAAVEDVENGARLVIQPDDPAAVETLRTAVGAAAEHMRQHGCGTKDDR